MTASIILYAARIFLCIMRFPDVFAISGVRIINIYVNMPWRQLREYNFLFAV